MDLFYYCLFGIFHLPVFCQLSPGFQPPLTIATTSNIMVRSYIAMIQFSLSSMYFETLNEHRKFIPCSVYLYLLYIIPQICPNPCNIGVCNISPILYGFGHICGIKDDFSHRVMSFDRVCQMLSWWMKKWTSFHQYLRYCHKCGTIVFS